MNVTSITSSQMYVPMQPEEKKNDSLLSRIFQAVSRALSSLKDFLWKANEPLSTVHQSQGCIIVESGRGGGGGGDCCNDFCRKVAH